MHRHFGFGGRHSDDRQYGRGPFGFHGHHPHGRRGMRGERMGRFFEHGDLRLVILSMLAEQPAHGYEIIKALEEKTGGAYSPSPGVVYPTLTLLEEQGFAAVAEAQGGKKLYTITDEGRAYLASNQSIIDIITARIAEAGARSSIFSPRVMRARENISTALKMKLSGGNLTEDQITAIVAALDTATAVIEQA
ncbi:MAG: transcriptional regulator, PadR-like family [Caulobacter sp.]|nr:transcriptional regulator, PadR-like family [Caulobacter sp.]